MKVKGMMAGMLAAVLFLTGCASIVGKNIFPLTINSNPDGAVVLVEDEHGKKVFNGTTPTTVTLASGEAYFHAKTYNITFSKPGYVEQHAVVKSTLSGWYWGNIIFGGLIGMLIVDPITGNMWKLPTEVVGNLTKQTALNQIEQTLQIVTLDQVPQDMRKHLIRMN
ncbi:MAG: PEGA domain-containing protein [Candidatus Omnitrophica bacterium]|nr:PEGA domain-containing protein [Candidatus Omnitrophota bacterium]